MAEVGCLKDGCFQNLQVENTTILDTGDTTMTGGSFRSTKRVTAVNAALDLTSVSTASAYSGGIYFMNPTAGAFAITLPSATTAAEATDLLGWHARFILTTVHGSNDITIIRGDGTNDSILPHGIVGIAASGAAGGITIATHIITFDASDTLAVGDWVEVYCYSADDTNTLWGATAICSS